MAFKATYRPSLVRQLWFPAALVGLLLLTIPGVVLFCLHVFGGDTEVNQWLEENPQLSYHFPMGWPLALVLLLIPPLDRKSTRLNSSHSQNSHAVFCL